MDFWTIARRLLQQLVCHFAVRDLRKE